MYLTTEVFYSSYSIIWLLNDLYLECFPYFPHKYCQCKWIPGTLWSLWLPLDVKNNFLIGTFLKRFVCALFRDFLIIMVFFVVSAALSMGSNSLLILGMSACNQLLCRLVSNLVYTYEIFLFVGLLLGWWYSFKLHTKFSTSDGVYCDSPWYCLCSPDG